MNATKKQAYNNDKNLTVRKTGYGHWKIEMDYYGKRISTTTTDSIEIDNWNSEPGEKDFHNRDRVKSGYESLCSQIINANYR